MVLRLVCEQAIAKECDLIEPQTLYVKDGKSLLPEAELRDAVETLDQQHMLRVHHVIGGDLPSFQITTHGFEEYACACIPAYDTLVRDVASALVNGKKEYDREIATDLGKPLIIVQHILQVLKDAGHLKLSKTLGGPRHIYNVAATCSDFIDWR